MLNSRDTSVTYRVQPRLSATLTIAGRPTAVTLELLGQPPARARIRRDGFVRAQYAALLPDNPVPPVEAALVLAGQTGAYAFELPGVINAGAAVARPATPIVVEETFKPSASARVRDTSA